MHEATRRLLGVLLQHLDGFDHKKKTGGSAFCGAHAVLIQCCCCCCLCRRRRRCCHCCRCCVVLSLVAAGRAFTWQLSPACMHNHLTVFIGATNRKADLDPALRSRFAASVTFGLPNEEAR